MELGAFMSWELGVGSWKLIMAGDSQLTGGEIHIHCSLEKIFVIACQN
jgi:hypothetical protein